MNIFTLLVISFCAGWGFMDITGRFTKFNDIVRIVLLAIFSWVVAVTL